jgi:OOP family OmpA-OmpF porin
MLTKYIYLTIIIYLMLINAALAQLDFRLTVAHGKMSLKPKTDLNIDISPKNYTTAGFQADYYITDNLGLGIGADYYLYDSEFDAVLSNYSHIYEGVDNWEGDPIPRDYEFTIRSNTPDIVEKNTISFIDIPISAIYNYPLVNNIRLATRLGFKIGLPLNDKYKLEESDLYTRLYFEEWDLELFDIPAHGLYDSRTDWHPEGELNLNPTLSIFSEIGLDFPIAVFKVRISGYFSYGLNNIIEENQSSLIY